MITYTFLQEYWYFLVALLGGLLVMLLFVQGANSLLYCAGRTEEERSLIVNATGRKWEFTFTTLVTFGGAFFAAFPLFYSTSFGGAYWVWTLILVSFVLQAVSYEFQSRPGNVLGRGVYRRFLVLNGLLGPFLLGTAVATFFTGSAFSVDHGQMAAGPALRAISSWDNAWHGLDALFNPWNIVLGLAVMLLARVLGALYLLNCLDDATLRPRLRRLMLASAAGFTVCFVAFVARLLTMPGYAVDAAGTVSLQPGKYLDNLLAMPAVAALLLTGTVLVLAGIAVVLRRPAATRGIWLTGPGTVLAVLALLLLAGYNGTAFYPSLTHPQSSLTLQNSCSSEFTLTVMAWVSLLIPFVLAYIAYAWRAIDRRSLTRGELREEEHKY